MEVRINGLECVMLRRGFNVTDVAKISGLSVWTIRNILKGLNVNIKSASAICNAFQDEGGVGVEVNGKFVAG